MRTSLLHDLVNSAVRPQTRQARSGIPIKRTQSFIPVRIARPACGASARGNSPPNGLARGIARRPQKAWFRALYWPARARYLHEFILTAPP